MFRGTLLSLALTCAVFAHDGKQTPRPPLTLVLEYETPPAPEAMAEMRSELESIMKETGLTLDWKLRSEMTPGTDVADLALVRLKGNCRMETMPIVFDERGPLAFAHTTEGEILPFTDVICDRVRVLTRSAMFGGDFAKGNQLLGRALARVVAHELYHIVSRDHQHDKAGLAREALSGKQLIADRAAFSQKSSAQIKRVR